jgi:hypothetical protein
VIGGARATALQCGLRGILTGSVPAAKRLGGDVGWITLYRSTNAPQARRAGAAVDKENVVHPTELPQT